MNARPLAEFIHAHAGRPALVIGGGASAPANAVRAPADAIVFSANQHGCILRAGKCDYIVACDEFGTRDQKRFDYGGRKVTLRDFGVPIVSPRRIDADIMMFKIPIHETGPTAGWVAWLMGCAPILLTGMDCYVGGTYFHNPKALSTGTHVPESTHVGRWHELKQKAPDGMFRILGCPPLKGVFPEYNPSERVTMPARPLVVPEASGKRVRLQKDLHVGVQLPGGLEVELSEGELRRARVEGALAREAKRRAA